MDICHLQIDVQRITIWAHFGVKPCDYFFSLFYCHPVHWSSMNVKKIFGNKVESFSRKMKFRRNISNPNLFTIHILDCFVKKKFMVHWRSISIYKKISHTPASESEHFLHSHLTLFDFHKKKFQIGEKWFKSQNTIFGSEHPLKYFQTSVITRSLILCLQYKLDYKDLMILFFFF